MPDLLLVIVQELYVDELEQQHERPVNAESRMPRIEKPKTIKNKQITAETARTSRELQITNLICFDFLDFEDNLRLA